ncbi:MAG: glycosyltransferase family 2 protein [Anaerolineae bacterium]
MPCLDEAATVAHCVAAARSFLRSCDVAGEILVIDNGSSDGSGSLAHAAGARVVDAEPQGYGIAVQHGIAAARGRYVIMGDADSSYDFTALEPFLSRLRGGVDVVIGSRLRGQILPGAMPPLHRWLGNPLLTAAANLRFGTHLSDYHSGLRGFQRQAILDLNLSATGMEWATEMIGRAAQRGLEIAEVPICYAPDGRNGRSHLKPLRDGWRHLNLILSA